MRWHPVLTPGQEFPKSVHPMKLTTVSSTMQRPLSQDHPRSGGADTSGQASHVAHSPLQVVWASIHPRT